VQPFLGDIMKKAGLVGRLVRNKYTNKVGIVLGRNTSRRSALFRYDVFIDGEVQSIPQNFLEVIV